MIAIDGPVAAGKTVVGRAVAHRLGFKYLDTGMMYRAITWLALQRGTPVDDEEALGELASAHPVRLKGRESSQVMIGDHHLGAELRSAPVDENVSLVSRVSQVRRALVSQQRELAAEGGIVVVGRDIGTVVLPDADLKVFLLASAESRARRRWLELEGQGRTTDFQRVLRETEARDEIDSHRADSPLLAARDAFLLDTEGLTVHQVVERILQRVQELAGVMRR